MPFIGNRDDDEQAAVLSMEATYLPLALGNGILSRNFSLTSQAERTEVEPV